ncbi:MAG: hypothetical protein WBW48_23955, partial [Anaerolineae bacterium]
MFVKDRIVRWARLIALFFLACLFLFSPVLAQEDEVTLTVLGQVVNTQQLAVSNARVRLFVGGQPLTFLNSNGEETDAVETFVDGSYILGVR